VEICVKKQINGECSTFLAELTVGEEIECFVRSNPDFAITAGNKPVIMIGAGTGIAPFMGMIRANRTKRPIQLFWGGRDPQSDFLYQSELLKGQQEHRLAGLTTAFSRVAERQYVQDKVRDESATIAEHVRRGASIMVCGGDAMAKAVRLELEKILAPLGLSVAQLIKNELYAEDIF
jgi:sulfite reductase (NADPH) flavoprotein alpha-component